MDTSQRASPIDNFAITCAKPLKSSTAAVHVQHKASDRERLTGAKTTISSFEDRLPALEEDSKEIWDRIRTLKEEKKLQDSFILEWETFNRIAEGLNDHIKTTILESLDDSLAAGKLIWDGDNIYQYLPHLFSQWWLSPPRSKDFPRPKAFDSLTRDEILEIQSRQPLNEEISQTAEMLWESELRPLIELMLTFYHEQLKAWNNFQHPTPPAAFAQAVIKPHIQSLDSDQQNVVLSIIDNGTRNGTSLFIKRIMIPSSSLAAGPSTALSPCAMGMMKGKTRQREVDDDGGISGKKSKRGE